MLIEPGEAEQVVFDPLPSIVRAGAGAEDEGPVARLRQQQFTPGLTHVRVDANISGDYVAAVKFINAAERDKMFFIVDQVNLGEQQGGTVRLAVGLETYVKGAAE